MTALLSLCKLVCNSLSFPASVSGVWQLDKCMYLTEIGVLATLMAEISFSKSTYVSFFFFFSLQCIKNCLHINVRNGLAPSFSISIMQIISFQDNHSQKQHLGQATGGLTRGNVTADQPESQVHVKSVSFIYLFIYDFFFFFFLANSEIVQTVSVDPVCSSQRLHLFYFLFHQENVKESKTRFISNGWAWQGSSRF